MAGCRGYVYLYVERTGVVRCKLFVGCVDALQVVPEEADVGIEQVGEFLGACIGRYARWVIGVTVAAYGRGSHLFAAAEKVGQGVDVLEGSGKREPYVGEQGAPVDFVPCVGMSVCLPVEPVAVHVVIGGIGQDKGLLASVLVGLNERILQDVGLAVGCEDAEQLPEQARRQVVVGVDERDIVSTGYLEAGISGIGEPAVLLVEHHDVVVAACQTVAYRAALVGRTVIDKYYLARTDAL